MQLRLPAFLVVLIAVAAAPAAYAQNAGASTGAGADPFVEARETRVWLTRIQDAANRRNFVGTVVVSAGGSVSSTRIAHYCEGRDQFERIDALDGQVRNVYRHNNVVHTVWPHKRLAVVERRDEMSSFPGLLQAGSERVQEHYALKTVAVERVAGHEADVLLLVKPQTGFSEAQKLKIDLSIYQWRHLIENVFCKLKEFKRIAMRSDKTDASFAGMINLCAAVINSR